MIANSNTVAKMLYYRGVFGVLIADLNDRQDRKHHGNVRIQATILELAIIDTNMADAAATTCFVGDDETIAPGLFS